MLLRHSAIYLLARGIPGIVGFATIFAYTRLLSPEEFGQYSLVVTGAVLGYSILYQWISASLLRFLPHYRNSERDLLATIFGCYLAVSFLVAIAGTLLVTSWWDSAWGVLIAIGVLLVWMQAWFAINVELTRSRLAPIHYGLTSTLKSAVALGTGVVLIAMGYHAQGALIGLLLGFSVSGLWASWGKWPSPIKNGLDRDLVKKLLSYGLPLTASFALGTVITTSDRFMLVWMIDESATGLYAAGQGLVQQAIITLMTMVHLAAYPLIIRALEESGDDAARVGLRKNAILLFGVGMPVTAVFVVLGPNIARVFLGEEFQSASASLLPWFAISGLLWCARTYYFDLAFFLGKRTRIHVFIMSVAALSNIALNVWLIPTFGLLGAVYASVAAHCIAVFMSAVVGRRAFLLPKISADMMRLFAATLAMAVPLVFLSNGEGVLRLALSIAVAGSVYFGFLIALNPANVRQSAIRILGASKYLSRFVKVEESS